MRTTTPFSLACLLIASMLLHISCRKEKVLDPSDIDKNYFVNEDNPNDPIDHAIYEFYKSTGIASFCNDTIYKKRIGGDNTIPARYRYIKLSLQYTLLGNEQNIYFEPLSSRDNIPALLTLLQQEMVPKLTSSRMIPSIFFIDTVSDNFSLINTQLSHGWTTIYGFNTVGITVKDVAVMNSGERKMYAASILAGVAEKRIRGLYNGALQTNFFNITRAASKQLFPFEFYSGFPYLYLLPPNTAVPPPQNIGLLFHITCNVLGVPMQCAPRETDDLRAFLTAAFYYTNQEFADLHPNQTHVLKKFGVIRTLAKDAGFKFPE